MNAIESMINSTYLWASCNISMIDACKSPSKNTFLLRPTKGIKRVRSMGQSNVLPWTDCAFIHLWWVDGAFESLDWSQQAFQTVLRTFFFLLLLLIAFVRFDGNVCVWVDEFQSDFAASIAQYVVWLAKCADHADFSRKYRMDAHPYYLEQDIQFHFDCSASHSIRKMRMWCRRQGLGRQVVNCLFNEFTPSTIQLHFIV